jgi:regulator of sigma E protease
MILTILIFIIILGLLVFVHEFGHFVVAKKSGMQVDEFGFGFPPRLFGFQKKAGKWAFVFGPRATQGPETVYSINMIPLGGFVKILGENNDQPDNPQSFARKPFFPRLFTLLAGVIMNVILAWVLISIGLMVGSPASVASRDEIPSGGKLKDVQVTVKDLLSGAPAQRAGIKVGDAVLDINGQSILTVPDMQEIVAASPATPLVFQIKRADQIVDITVTPDKNSLNAS